MTGLLIKLIVCPIGVVLAWMLFPNVDFSYWYQPIIIGVILAVIGRLMEVMLLRKNTVWLSTFLDIIASFAIVYIISNFFQSGASVTFWGAVLTALLLGLSEVVQHQWLVKNEKAEQEPAH